jgi:hypothetical protein
MWIPKALPGFSFILFSACQDDDWFDIYDPRNPLNKRRREKDELEGKIKEKMRIKSTL